MNKPDIRFVRPLMVAVLVALPALAPAGVVVVAHSSVKANALSEDEVRQLFMGRSSRLPDGTAVAPLDLNEAAPSRNAFLSSVMGKTEQQMRSYWTRLIFTGKAQPPKVLATDAEVLRTVASSPGYVGYADAVEAARANVKILYKVE